jgi:hypothetical protein
LKKVLTNQNRCDIILVESEANKMFVHEYGDKEFESYEDCREEEGEAE